ncbi:MAG: hypothetical protein PHF24_06500, partial [Syntrophomonas sp.]|nr:hypothetical protein [Syntrophomonas sp.]
KLHIGNWGDSNAFLIALRLGMDKHIIERAHEVSYGEKISFDGEYSLKIDSIIDQKDIKQHDEDLQRQTQWQINKAQRERSQIYKKKAFKLGDSVYISTMKRAGIVCEEENKLGDLMVMVMGKKYVVNHKRLTPHIDRKELYPENYDLDVVFETKENRKKRKIMSKHHVEGLVIEYDNDKKD